MLRILKNTRQFSNSIKLKKAPPTFKKASSQKSQAIHNSTYNSTTNTSKQPINNSTLTLVRHKGRCNSNIETPFLENELHTLGNLVNKLTYNPETENFQIKLIYKYEAYGFLNSNAIDTVQYEFHKDELEYYGMLEDVIHQYPSKRQTYFEFKKFHEWNKILAPMIKTFKANENKKRDYNDSCLEDIIVLKILPYSPKSPFPGYVLVPQKYSSVDYENMEKYVKHFSFTDDNDSDTGGSKN